MGQSEPAQARPGAPLGACGQAEPREVPPVVDGRSSPAGPREVLDTSRRRSSRVKSCELSERTLKRFRKNSVALGAAPDRDPRIRRGTRLWKVLRFGGCLWRTSPIDLAEDERESLFDLSEPCESLSAFLSHTWATPGWQKYVALLEHFHRREAMAIGILLGLLAWLLDLAGMLPRMALQGGEVSPWSALPPVLGIVAVFLLPHCVPDQGGLCFFDATCINQVNEELKMKGIYNLAQALMTSEELIVLWTPEYLRRAWCAHELAMFNVLSKGKIIWCPAALQLMVPTVNLVMAIAMLADTLTSDEDFAQNFCKKAPAMLMIASFTASMMRPLCHEVKQLPSQLEGFDICQAQCRRQDDREYIKESVEHWYGSEDKFNAYVRGPLKQRVALTCIEFPFTQVMMMSWPRLCYAAQWIAAQVRAGMPSRQLACFAAGALVNEALSVASNVKMGLGLFAHFSAPRGSWIEEVFVNVGIGALIVASIIIHDAIPRIDVIDHSMWNHQPWVQLSYATGTAVLAAVLFRTDIQKWLGRANFGPRELCQQSPGGT